jgi:hypothetical protein
MRQFLFILASVSVWLCPQAGLAAAHPRASKSGSKAPYAEQTAPAEGNVDSQYERMRAETLAHARMIAGPKTKNPHLATIGVDTTILAVMAEQRAYLQSHVAMQSFGPSLLHSQRTTLPGNSYSNSNVSSQPSVSFPRPIPLRSSCPSPTIRSVNGRKSGVVFTPIEPDNYYRIQGCRFGTTPGSVRLQPDLRNIQTGVSSRALSMELDSPAGWTDDEITVHIDPTLSGVSDFPVDMVVHLADGHELPLLGCIFVAVRGEPLLLKVIPAAWVKLDATFASSRPIGQLEFLSPPVASEETPNDTAGLSVLVVRSDREAFASGRDLFDFSQLSPGWAVESLQLNQFGIRCPGNTIPAESKGAWAAIWTPRGFSVSWAKETCTSSASRASNFTLNSSQYAARVWVIGPAGTQPMRNGF